MGDVTVSFLENSWNDQGDTTGLSSNLAYTQTFTVVGATAGMISPRPGDSDGLTSANRAGGLEVIYRATKGNEINADSIDGDELMLIDAEGNEVALGAPERQGD